MVPKRRRNIEFLTISALDIFASAMGVFVLIILRNRPFRVRYTERQKTTHRRHLC